MKQRHIEPSFAAVLFKQSIWEHRHITLQIMCLSEKTEDRDDSDSWDTGLQRFTARALTESIVKILTLISKDR